MMRAEGTLLLPAPDGRVVIGLLVGWDELPLSLLSLF